MSFKIKWNGKISPNGKEKRENVSEVEGIQLVKYEKRCGKEKQINFHHNVLQFFYLSFSLSLCKHVIRNT